MSGSTHGVGHVRMRVCAHIRVHVHTHVYGTGAVISPHDDRIYCIPQSATRVLRIDPKTDECELIGPELPGRCKWYALGV